MTAVLFDFHCALHGYFEAMSESFGAGVQSVPCPHCGELAPQIWLRPPAMRGDGIPAIKFGNRIVTEEQLERELDAKPDKAVGWYDKPGARERFDAALERNAALADAGNLPGIEQKFTPKQLTVLKEGLEKAAANG